LERQFVDWEKQIESELAVSQRISEKTKADNKQLNKEMQKQVLQSGCVSFWHSLYFVFRCLHHVAVGHVPNISEELPGSILKI
jgi:hypothetical protein